jgi:hypothetical protein
LIFLTGFGLALWSWTASAAAGTDRHWDGSDPYYAAAGTTDYYGSGDVDLDGSLSPRDLDFIRDMIAGTRPWNVRADVDGNGRVDADDLALLESALQGGTLPAGWNRLGTPTQRISWIDRVAALDLAQLNSNREAGTKWNCYFYSTRCFLRFAPQVMDPANTLYADYGVAQSIYNLPVYFVDVISAGFGHSLNAILVGDDPAYFTNWYMLEPQQGNRAYPGAWDLPWGAHVSIVKPDGLNAPYHSSSSVVEFDLDLVQGPITTMISPDLLRQRPQVASVQVANSPDMWNPILIPEKTGMWIFNGRRDDMVRETVPCLLTNLDLDPRSSQPLLMAGGFQRLLSIAPAAAGQYHLLWASHTNWVQVLYYGLLDTSTATIGNATVVATNVMSATILGMTTNDAYAFYETDIGLTSVHIQGGVREPAEMPVTWTSFADKIGIPCFTVLTNVSRQPVVIWSDETSYDQGLQTTISRIERRIDGWHSPEIVTVISSFVPSLWAQQDRSGTTHLVYNSTWFPVFTGYSDNLPQELWQVVRGDVNYCSRTTNSSAVWSTAVIVASNSFWPTLTVTRNGSVLIGWETDHDGRVVPFWSDHTAQTVPQAVTNTATPYQPAMIELNNGAILFSWNEISQAGAVAKYQTIRNAPPPPPILSIARTASGIILRCAATPGDTFQAESSDSLAPASWQALGPATTTQTNVWSQNVPIDPVRQMRYFRVRRL